MVRVFKRYNFKPVEYNPLISANTVLFAGYPGCLSSLDDYYVMDSNIFVTETSLEVYNDTLYEALSPNSVMSWARTNIANRFAMSGENWCMVYSKYTSGTYNNQWMVVDYNLYVEGISQLLPGTVTVLEQLPGYIEWEDVTPVVNAKGYWASYNVPYFNFIYDIGGYVEAAKEDPENGKNCSRAKIFARDGPKVQTWEDMKTIMQYNEFQTDPYSSGNACNTIVARCDLNVQDPDAFGGLDAKIANSAMISEVLTLAISGPTHQNQVPFTWDSPIWQNVSHLGQPTLWNFDWVLMNLTVSDM